MTDPIDLQAIIRRRDIGAQLGGGWLVAQCGACGQRVITNRHGDTGPRVLHRPTFKLDWTGEALLEDGGECSAAAEARRMRKEAQQLEADADAIDAALRGAR